MEEEINGFAALEETLGFTFADREKLLTALTHTSFVKGDGAHAQHNERMEFLGDAVLELCVSDYLYRRHPDLDEGALTRMRARLVCENALYAAAKALSLPGYIRLGHGEERTGGRDKPSVVSDAMEAVIGAVYLDAGIEAARALIVDRIVALLETASVDAEDKDFKTRLQEYVQHDHLGKLTYVLVSAVGPEHEKCFTVRVRLGDEDIGEGAGHNKQQAGQRAARSGLAFLKAERRRQEGNKPCD